MHFPSYVVTLSPEPSRPPRGRGGAGVGVDGVVARPAAAGEGPGQAVRLAPAGAIRPVRSGPGGPGPVEARPVLAPREGTRAHFFITARMMAAAIGPAPCAPSPSPSLTTANA